MHSCTASIVNEMSNVSGSSLRGVSVRLCFFRFTRFRTVVVWCKLLCLGGGGCAGGGCCTLLPPGRLERDTYGGGGYGLPWPCDEPLWRFCTRRPHAYEQPRCCRDQACVYNWSSFSMDSESRGLQLGDHIARKCPRPVPRFARCRTSHLDGQS
jgi:hypothetical protein